MPKRKVTKKKRLSEEDIQKAHRGLTKSAEKAARTGKLKKKKGETTEEAKDRYIYGGKRNKLGWKPKREKGGKKNA